MEVKRLKDMIERFFDAQLTVDEERELCRWLSDNDVPAELRRDKEVILTLCEEPVGDELPVGAVGRLEAMIDNLAEVQEITATSDANMSKDGRRILKIPRIAIGGAVAAAMAAVAYITMFGGEQNVVQKVEETQSAVVMAEVPEEDTFDNPEDAMECFKGALGNMMLAVNTTRENTRKMENTLNKAVAPYKNMIKINIQ